MVMNLNELTSQIDHDTLCRILSITFAEIYGETSVQSIDEKDMKDDSAFLRGLEEIKVSDRLIHVLKVRYKTRWSILIVQGLDLWTNTRI